MPPETKTVTPDVTTTLVAFNDGSYKKIRHIAWKHSQWIHFTRENGTTVSVNPQNVNYLEF
jgi:hypothetical protein